MKTQVPMQKQMSPLPTVWACRILPALLCSSIAYASISLFKIRLEEGLEKGSLIQCLESLTVSEVLHSYAL